MTAARRLRALPLVAVLGISGVGCGSGSSAPSAPGSAHDRTITVLAAASLTEAFTQLAHDYEKTHPGTKVDLSFSASSTIVQQLRHDAPADVVALADTQSAKKLPTELSQGKAWTPIATNRLEIATPKGNPGHVSGLADLAKVDTVLCAKQVPCGRAADKALTKAHVTPRVVSYERDVKATLAKVAANDADAAVVYATDVKAAGDRVQGVTIPAASNVTTTLPLAVWQAGPAASGFADYIKGENGRKVLTEKGFGTPD